MSIEYLLITEILWVLNRLLIKVQLIGFKAYLSTPFIFIKDQLGELTTVYDKQ